MAGNKKLQPVDFVGIGKLLEQLVIENSISCDERDRIIQRIAKENDLEHMNLVTLAGYGQSREDILRKSTHRTSLEILSPKHDNEYLSLTEIARAHSGDAPGYVIVSTLERRKMAQMHVEGISVFELTDFIVASAGFANSVNFPASYVERLNWYTVVIPIIGLKIEAEMGIGNVQFCSSENDEIKRILPFDERFLLFQSFAVVHVNNSKIYAATMQAKKQIEQGLDLLINMIKDDSLYSMHSIGNVLLERSNTRFEKKVFLSSFVYIESPLTSGKMSCDLSDPDSTPDLVADCSVLKYKKEFEKAELLLLRANGASDKDVSPLFDSLKWVRRAWDADDSDDKIIYSIIALEFIVSKEPNTPFMEKALRKKCKGEIRRIIAAAKLSGLNPIDYTKSVCDKFDRVYTETPFMQKLRNLIDRLSIPLTDREMELIESARRQRNHIVHGDSESKLPADDVYRLCECISRITFYKIQSLEIL